MFLRVTAVIAAVTLTMALFSGCGKKAVNDKDEQGRTVISVGSWPTKKGKTLDDMNARKATFEAENPDSVIKPDSWVFDIKTFYAKATGNQLPTLYTTFYTEMSQIIEENYSADLTDVLKKRGYDGKFNKKVLDVVSKNGRVYAFPNLAYVLGLGYNTELFEKAGLMEADGTPKQPKDWNELAEFAVKIKKATGKSGFIFPSMNNYGGWMFTCVAWSFGVDFMKQESDGKWTATFDGQEAVDALQYIKDLRWKYDVLPSNTLIDSSEYFKSFATGNAAMLICADTISSSVSSYGMMPDQLGMMAMPAGPKKHVTLMGGGLSCLRNDATEDQIDAALRWIEMEYNHKVTENYKTNLNNKIDEKLAANHLVGIKSMNIWNGDTESFEYKSKLIEEKANSNINHVKLYNDFVENCPAEIQPEEPVCCQELYGILDSCIQEVLLNENANCAEILKKANSDFQVNYLDNLTY